MQRWFPGRGRAWFAALVLGVFLSSAAVSPARADLPKVPDGFKIRLVAAVPAVQYPCQVATAPDGSLFVGEDPMDQVGPATKPIDRILLFREGKEPVVFADKLNAIFGMVWHDGALYVMNMPHLTVLRDRDGDGKADERKELFTDMGVPAGTPNDFNDHIVSGLKIGIDGYLYISVGDKGVPKATGPDKRTAQVVGGGVLRCRLGRHRPRGLFDRHAQPPRAQPRRPRQPLHLRQHRRRPGLVDPGDTSTSTAVTSAIRTTITTGPTACCPGSPSTAAARRAAAISTATTSGPRSIAAASSGPSGASAWSAAFRFAPDGGELQDRREDRVRRARPVESFRPLDLALQPRRQRRSTSPTGRWEAGATRPKSSAGSTR